MDREKIKKLYLLGYTTKEIAAIINENENSIKTCIRRNFRNLREKHFYANKMRKEALKALDYEAKKDIGNKAFIENNMSIYTMKENGSIVINKAVAPLVTYDTPKRLSREEDLTRKS